MREEEEAAQEILAVSSVLLDPPQQLPGNQQQRRQIKITHGLCSSAVRGRGMRSRGLDSHHSTAGVMLLGAVLCLDFLIANQRAVFQLEVIWAGARNGAPCPQGLCSPALLRRVIYKIVHAEILRSECTTSPRWTFFLKEGPSPGGLT